MSYEAMNFIDGIASQIKDFIECLSKRARNWVLLLIEDAIKDLILGRSDH